MGGGGEREGGREGDYIPIATVSPPEMIPALRWAAMFQWEVMDKVTRQCPQTTTFLKRKESRSMEVGGDYIPIATLSQQSDFCIKIGSRR